MDLAGFMSTYQRAWETADEELLVSLFAADGVYHNTPFAEQRGHDPTDGEHQPPVAAAILCAEVRFRSQARPSLDMRKMHHFDGSQ